MRSRGRLQRLEKFLPAPTTEELHEERLWRKVVYRLAHLLERALPLMSDAEEDVVSVAILECSDNRRGPLEQWIDDLRWGRSRLPELSAEATRQVICGWLHPDRGDAMVCSRCGLECPRSVTRSVAPCRDPDRYKRAEFAQMGTWPRYLDPCPCCGSPSRDADWPQYVERKSLPWKALDGWIGAPQQRRKGTGARRDSSPP